MSFSNETVSKYESVQSVTAATNETLVDSGETAKDAILGPCKVEPVFPVPTTVGSPILENEKSQKDAEKTPEIVNNSDSSLSQGAQSPVQSFDSTILAIDVASNEQSSGIDAIFPSKPDLTLIEKARQDIIEEINPSARKENKGLCISMKWLSSVSDQFTRILAYLHHLQSFFSHKKSYRFAFFG